MTDTAETRVLKAARRLRAHFPKAQIEEARFELANHQRQCIQWWIDHELIIAFCDAVDALPPEKEQADG